MRVLLIGGGGREHALAVALRRDAEVTELHAAPGNPGIGQLAALHRLDVSDTAAIAGLATRTRADLVVIGPEAPLVAGAADAVRAAGIPCFGPSAAAARIEGSKAFAKEVMAAAGIPTAMAHVCDTPAEAAAALDAYGSPYVVKDDALAAGKGVVVTHDRAAALAHASSCDVVVIEEYLQGPEVSLFAVTDGTTVVALAPAQDFKRVRDGDTGPNTGGMGAYSPLPWAPPHLARDIVDRVVQPAVDELRARGTPFVGLLYAGIALTAQGIRVIEFNARFGDPETQVVLARLQTPLGALLHAAATGQLDMAEPLHWGKHAAVAVVLAAHGYPGAVRTGDPIEGCRDAEDIDGALVLQAGTALDPDGRLVSAGGRVLSVVGTGPDLGSARDTAYRAVERLRLEGSHHRSDIAAAAAAGTVSIPTPLPIRGRTPVHDHEDLEGL